MQKFISIGFILLIAILSSIAINPSLYSNVDACTATKVFYLFILAVLLSIASISIKDGRFLKEPEEYTLPSVLALIAVIISGVIYTITLLVTSSIISISILGSMLIIMVYMAYLRLNRLISYEKKSLLEVMDAYSKQI